MNKNINLKEILKDCPIGFKLYSPLYGEVVFEGISDSEVYPITTINSFNRSSVFSKEGFYNAAFTDSECVLFPSKTQRDWDKFKAPWLKKDKFDPKTLKPFDKVLVRDDFSEKWRCDFFSYMYNDNRDFPYFTIRDRFRYCIPYNDDTNHLVGKVDEAPEYYRYWEEGLSDKQN